MPEKILYGGGYRFEVVEVMEWTQGHFGLLSETIRYRFFCMVWNRAYSKIFCISTIFIVWSFVFI